MSTPVILMRVGYDGTDFSGFARQEGLRTVQGELEAGLQDLYGHPVLVRGASRTDAGVHARGQVVAYDVPPGGGPPPERVRLALWGKLPPDLEVSASWAAHSITQWPLHPRRHNLGKHYRYMIRCARGRDPLLGRYAWELGRDLDLAAMVREAEAFVGVHDFSSFRAAGCQAKTTERELYEVRVQAHPSWTGIEGDKGQAPAPSGPAGIQIDVHGSAFLMHMVRIMVGTLVEVGTGRQPAGVVADLLENHDRTKAGQTAPARGLTLEEVKWPRQWPPVAGAAKP